MPKRFSRNCDFCASHYVGQGRKFCSIKCRARAFGEKMRGWPREKFPFYGRHHSPESLKKKSAAQIGHLGSNWQGGKTPLNRAIRKRSEMRPWREAVFKRDNFTCQICGKRGGVLNADHIKPFSLFPELRFVVSNGRTLCEECHRQTPTFGGRIKKLVMVYAERQTEKKTEEQR